jgi:hypothetical protein
MIVYLFFVIIYHYIFMDQVIPERLSSIMRTQ